MDEQHYEPQFRCGPVVTGATTRDELIARGIKPEAADELLAFRERLRAKAALCTPIAERPRGR